MKIRRASRQQTLARVLMEGPAGAGKTKSSLRFANGLMSKLGLKECVVIDTERGSSNAYEADIPDGFGVIDLEPPYKPELLVDAISMAEDAGADVIIIDSVSHFWSGEGGCLEINDDLARSKYRGNSWSAWSETKKRWRRMVERINGSSAHVVVTGRSKTETAQADEGGRKKVVRLGMKLEAGDSLEYEFQVAFSVSHESHLALCVKDRTGVFVDRDPEIITPEFGERMADWILGGKPAPPPELVEEVKVEPTPFQEAKQFLLNGCTKEQAKKAQVRIVDLAAEGKITAREMDELIKLCGEKL